MSSMRMQVPVDLADDVHDLGFACPLAPFVDDRQRRIAQALGKASRAHHTADVGRDDGQCAIAEARLDVGRNRRGSEEVVGRYVEEALDLPRVKVDRQHPVGARGGDQIGDELGRNRRPRPGLPVLPGIAEIGQNRRDPLCRRAPQRVDADQKLHQIVVGGVARRLNDEDVLAANILVDLYEHLFVREPAHARVG